MTYIIPAFPGGTSTWRELDRVADRAVDAIEEDLCDMTELEKEYILRQVSDFVENWLWDLTPQEYKDKVAAQATPKVRSLDV